MQKFSIFIKQHWAVLLIAVAINALVLTNSILHDPRVGYDVGAHYQYVKALSKHLPARKDTREFFSPPLPYFLPALFDVTIGRAQTDSNTRFIVDGKFAQFLNFLLSIGITVLLWKIAERLRPGSDSFKAALLGMLGILPVYYKTFSQPRGEPYVAFFLCLVVFLVLAMLQKLEEIGWKQGLMLGLALGALILSRQWGFFVFPALAALAALGLGMHPQTGWRFARVLAVAFIVALIAGGWFYLHLYRQNGSFTTFNRPSPGFSFSNQPLSFYRNLELERLALFRTPVRPYFANELIPILYSDTWGDYWCFFVCKNENLEVVSGPQTIQYLGRVNLVSLYPTLILLGGVALVGAGSLLRVARRKGEAAETLFQAFLFLVILFSAAGYLWFLISYPEPIKGDTNKATYIIQVFMAAPVLAAFFLEQLKTKKTWIYALAMGALFLVFLHNLSAMITHNSLF